MRDLEIEVFLAIYKHRSFSKAAEKMFMSQSSISERLKSLEKKLGFALLQRNRGNREIALTPEGRAFYELALQRQEITRMMCAIGEPSQTIKLRVSGLSSINGFLFPMVYHRFSQRYPQSELQFYSMNAHNALIKLAAREIDLAFSTYGAQKGQVTATPFVSEHMVLICSDNSDYPDVVEQHMLSLKDEIYRRWSYDFERWHHSFFGSDSPPMVLADSLDRFWPYFETRPNTWSIVPHSVAAGLCTSSKIRQCQMAFYVPDRMIFSHTLYDTAKNDHILLFQQCFREILQEQGTGLLW